MPIEVIDKIVQKNNGSFFLMEAKNIEIKDGLDLETYLDNGVPSSGGGYYIGTDPPDNKELMWIDVSDEEELDKIFDNVIINEFKAVIASMQEKIKQLEADVEYLKLYGGGGITPPTPEVNFCLLTEDGDIIICEDGNTIVLEDYNEVISSYNILTENGDFLFTEDNYNLILEGA